MKSLQPSKKNIQQCQKIKFSCFYFFFSGHFCPSADLCGSMRFRIRIRNTMQNNVNCYLGKTCIVVFRCLGLRRSERRRSRSTRNLQPMKATFSPFSTCGRPTGHSHRHCESVFVFSRFKVDRLNLLAHFRSYVGT